MSLDRQKLHVEDHVELFSEGSRFFQDLGHDDKAIRKTWMDKGIVNIEQDRSW